jgi:phosphate transport system substrate-binding protein
MNGRMVACSLSVALAAVFAGSPAGASGTVTIAGSTTLLPLVREAAQSFQNQHTDVLLVVSGGGSHAAIQELAGKQIDIAATDVPSGSSPEFVDHRIAVIAFAIAVNPLSGVSTLTKKQLQDVLGGRVTNWKDLGGNDVPIVIVNRPPVSGVRALIGQRIMDGAAIAETGAVDESTVSTVDDLKASPGAIGYASFGGLRDSGLTLLGIDGVAATDANVQNGTYPLWAYEHMITFGPPTPDVSRFLAFIETNRSLLHAYGYIAVPDMKASAQSG